MKLIHSEFGKFPDVEKLNKRFVPNRFKQKLTIDTLSPSENYRRAYPVLMNELYRLFPSLTKHDCSYRNDTQVGHPTQSALEPLTEYHGVIDILHVVEHIMIELQVPFR